MPLTPMQALPYPVEDDPNTPPAHILALAQALEPQLVLQFATAAERASKVSVPSEGMLCWLQDVNRFERHDGTSWIEVPDLTKVNTLIAAYDARPKGPIVRSLITASSALGSSLELVCQATFSNPSANRIYALHYYDLYESDSSGATIYAQAFVTGGSSPSSSGTNITWWQFPVNEDGTREYHYGRGTGFPTGTVTVGIYAKKLSGTAASTIGTKVLEIDDVGQ